MDSEREGQVQTNMLPLSGEAGEHVGQYKLYKDIHEVSYIATKLINLPIWYQFYFVWVYDSLKQVFVWDYTRDFTNR